MAGRENFLTGVERTFKENEIIVSKTNTKGILTYANELFLKLADYSQQEVIGKPHSIIRHPNMPKCIFRLLWKQIKEGREIFAYVVNRSRNGDHYWVMAHVTPSFDAGGNIIGFHSNRRVARREALAVIEPLYQQLRAIETSSSSPEEGMKSSFEKLASIIEQKGVGYDQFILTL